MPYYGYLSIPFTNSLKINETRGSTWGPPWQGNMIDIPPYPFGTKHSSFRNGSNSPFEQGALVPVGTPKFRFKRVFLGYEEVESKSIRRVHRKDGVSFKIHTKVKRVKRWGQTLAHSHYDQYVIKKNVYLKPNHLQYSAADISVTPESSMFESNFTYSHPGVNGPNSSISTNVRGEFSGLFYYQDRHHFDPDRRFSVSVFPPVGDGSLQQLRPSISEGDKARALSRLYEKILEETPNYYSMLAESGETFDQLRKIAAAGLSLAKDLYRLNGKAILKRTKDINLKNAADTYLGWVYGMAPVISDLKKAVDNYSREARAWRTYSAGVLSQDILTPQSSQWLNARESEYSYRSFCRYGVTLEGKISLARILERAQSWEQTAATVIEVIPFSFMLDWIVDITGYLNAVHVVEGREIDAWYTEGLVMYYYESGKPKVAQAIPQPRDFSIDISMPDMTVLRKVVYCARQPLFQLPALPKPVIPKASQLLDGVTLQRGINALAIAVSRQFGLKDRWSRDIDYSRRRPKLNLRGL